MPLPVIAATGFFGQVMAFLFAFSISKIIAKVLAFFGVGFVAYVGFSSLIDQIQGYIDGNMAGIPENIFRFVSILNVPQAINLTLSAYAGRYTVFALSKRITFNPPGSTT